MATTGPRGLYLRLRASYPKSANAPAQLRYLRFFAGPAIKVYMGKRARKDCELPLRALLP